MRDREIERRRASAAAVPSRAQNHRPFVARPTRITSPRLGEWHQTHTPPLSIPLAGGLFIRSAFSFGLRTTQDLPNRMSAWEPRARDREQP